MPELAEVLWFARRWNAGLDAVVTGIRLDADARVFRDCDTAALVKALPGQRLREIKTKAKQAAFVFSGGAWLGVHLGMTGRLFTEARRGEQPVWAREETGEAPRSAPLRKHDLLTLDCDNGASLVFNDYRRFGKILFHAGPGVPPWWSALSPEIRDPEFTPERTDAFLKRHGRVAIKSLLLDQSGFPGVGNWMADEILWRAGLAPRRRAGELTPEERSALFAAVREVCVDALRVIGEDWGAPPDSWLFNHRWRKGGRCPATGQPLEYVTIGGRTSCWSPAKQR